MKYYVCNLDHPKSDDNMGLFLGELYTRAELRHPSCMDGRRPLQLTVPLSSAHFAMGGGNVLSRICSHTLLSLETEWKDHFSHWLSSSCSVEMASSLETCLLEGKYLSSHSLLFSESTTWTDHTRISSIKASFSLPLWYL